MGKQRFKGFVRLTEAEFETLVTQGSVTLASGQTIIYSPYDTIYLTPSSGGTPNEYIKSASINSFNVVTLTNKEDETLRFSAVENITKEEFEELF